MENVLDVFVKTLKKYDMVQKGDTVLIAISGGPDSVTLFDLLYQIRADWQLNLHIVHLNHSLRGEESDKDQAFVEQFAKDLKVPSTVKRANVEDYGRVNRLSVEEAARECRLQFFREVAEKLGVSKVAVGHHRDDQAETVLFRILRGTGLRGLVAIRPVIEMKGITLIRPLIDLEKRDIENYIRDRRLPFRTDLSNAENRFMRNKIRHKLLPELERHYNPRIKSMLANLAETVSLDLSYIEDQVHSAYPRVVKKKKDSHLVLHKGKFLKLPAALRFRVLAKAVRDLDPESELDYFHWDEFRRALDRESNHHTVNIAHEVLIGVERKEILLRKELADTAQQYAYELPLGGRVFVKEAGLELNCESFERRIYKLDRRDKSVGIFDLDRVRFPVFIRNRREGDRFRPLGIRYEKKLKDFLIGRKVASYEKNKIPLLVSGADIFWIYGVEISDHYKVTNRTRKFLKVTGKLT